MTDDEKLKEEFARLRSVDARRTPSLKALTRPPKARPLRPAVLAVLPLVAAAAALLFVCNGPTRSEPPMQATVAASTPPAPEDEPLPLDFLLQTHVASTDLGGSDFLLRAPKDLRGLTP